jgi:chemotaxis protein CheC
VSAPALGEAQLDALREIGNIGAGTAATALAQMTGRSVPMGVPTVSARRCSSASAAR